MKTLYAVLFVAGCVLPLSQLVPWVIAHGVDAFPAARGVRWP